MNNSIEIFLLVLGLVVLLGALIELLSATVRRAAQSISEARQYAAKMMVNGYLPPAPSDKAHSIMVRICRVLCWIFIGKIEVHGAENLKGIGSNSYIVTPNHPSPYDVVLLPVVHPRKSRYMAAQGVMQALGGLGGLLVGPFGAFGVNLDRGKGGRALRSAVFCIGTGQVLVMWPEGWTYLDGEMRPFKRGAVRIAKDGAIINEFDTKIVPVGINYARLPGKTIMRLPIKLQYLALVLAFPFFRKGVTVVFGKPIASSDLPECDRQASAYLQEKVQELLLKR